MIKRIAIRTYGDSYVREPNECKELNDMFEKGFEVEHVTPMKGYIEYILYKFVSEDKECEVKEEANGKEETTA